LANYYRQYLKQAGYNDTYIEEYIAQIETSWDDGFFSLTGTYFVNTLILKE